MFNGTAPLEHNAILCEVSRAPPDTANTTPRPHEGVQFNAPVFFVGRSAVIAFAEVVAYPCTTGTPLPQTATPAISIPVAGCSIHGIQHEKSRGLMRTQQFKVPLFSPPSSAGVVIAKDCGLPVDCRESRPKQTPPRLAAVLLHWGRYHETQFEKSRINSPPFHQGGGHCHAVCLWCCILVNYRESITSKHHAS